MLPQLSGTPVPSGSRTLPPGAAKFNATLAPKLPSETTMSNDPLRTSSHFPVSFSAMFSTAAFLYDLILNHGPLLIEGRFSRMPFTSAYASDWVSGLRRINSVVLADFDSPLAARRWSVVGRPATFAPPMQSTRMILLVEVSGSALKRLSIAPAGEEAEARTSGTSLSPVMLRGRTTSWRTFL